MGLVVFFRAANVGGHQTFRPSLLAEELSAFGLVNIGAAGTLVAPDANDGAALAKEIRRRVSLVAEVIVRPGHEIVDLAARRPFGAATLSKELEGYLTILTALPPRPPRLPIESPTGAGWQVRVVGTAGVYAWSLRRRGLDRPVYPNALIESQFGVAATTRNWTTVEKILSCLRRAVDPPTPSERPRGVRAR